MEEWNEKKVPHTLSVWAVFSFVGGVYTVFFFSPYLTLHVIILDRNQG